MDASASVPALQVLTNPTLFSLISSFQRGVPLWVVDYECMFSHDNLLLPRNDRAKQSMGVSGLLPRLAIQNHDLDTLGKLLNLSQQEYCQTKPKFSFYMSLDEAARIGSVEVLQWLCDFAAATYLHGAIWTAVLNGQDDATRWLLANFPECDDEITAAHMDTAAKNGDLGVVQVLHEQSRVYCSAQAMNDAAANGHVAVVEFLHERRLKGCTTAAVDGAARNGHHHYLKWLLLRGEGFTKDAVAGAIVRGHVEVLQCLWENGGQNETAFRCGIYDAVPLALATMPFAMVALLYEIMPEAFPRNALLLAASFGRDEVEEYLRVAGTYREGVDASLLFAAASQAHAEAQLLLDREEFSLDVLREALDESMKTTAEGTSAEGSSDPQGLDSFAFQIRLRQLIEKQTATADVYF